MEAEVMAMDDLQITFSIRTETGTSSISHWDDLEPVVQNDFLDWAQLTLETAAASLLSSYTQTNRPIAVRANVSAR